jgi:hypothetical protein
VRRRTPLEAVLSTFKIPIPARDLFVLKTLRKLQVSGHRCSQEGYLGTLAIRRLVKNVEK